MKKIIKLGLSGELNREDDVTEKTDGQNLMITYRDGKVLAARNKGQIKNRGQNALDAKGVAKKFSGRGDIRDAFVFAMSDLTKSINSLSDKQKDKIFKNGEIFMNLEIIYPASSNVIDYDKQILQFHNSIKYDKNGNAVGEVKGSGRMLQGMIKQVNQDIGKHFKIIKPRVLDLPKKIDFGKKVDIYYKRVNKLQSQFGLKDTDTLGKYHQSYWENYIYNAGKQFGYTMPKTILKKLTKRWAFFDKSYKIPNIKKDLKKQPKFLDWVMNTDKVDHKNMVKKNMLPFEKIFFSVGADILLNLSNFIAANPTKAIDKIRKDILKASNKVRAGGDIKKMKTLKQQLEKLNSLGGLNKIVPVEGIVFKYKGKTYKFTGAFAPVNQILGLVSF
jgi:DNA-binding transcriptional regulator GbsR (MarR family)